MTAVTLCTVAIAAFAICCIAPNDALPTGATVSAHGTSGQKATADYEGICDGTDPGTAVEINACEWCVCYPDVIACTIECPKRRRSLAYNSRRYYRHRHVKYGTRSRVNVAPKHVKVVPLPVYVSRRPVIFIVGDDDDDLFDDK